MSELSDETLKIFIALIHQHAGITMDLSRKSLVQSRLRPRLRELNLATFEAYIDYLRAKSSETQMFVDRLTTNETCFYRTPRIWAYVSTFVPQWFQANPGKIFRAWSAAASSGEEAHTLGVLLQDFRTKHPTFQYQIVGTDICTDVLARAKTGVYSGKSIESFRKLQPELFAKFMVAQGEGFRANDEIRSRIQFRRQNLFEKMTAPDPFDVVLLRNVLIYFNGPDQVRVLSEVRRAMRPEGTLIIGESESLSQIQTPFLYREPLIYAAAA